MNCFGFFHYIFNFFLTVLVVHHHHLVTTVLTHSILLWRDIALLCWKCC